LTSASSLVVTPYPVHRDGLDKYTSMNEAASSGLWRASQVHLDRLRSPLGAALFLSAMLLLVTLLVLRRRRQRRIETVRGRRLSVGMSSSSLRARRLDLVTLGQHKTLMVRAGEFVRRHRRPNLAEVLEPYRIIPLDTPGAPTEDAWELLTLPQLKRLSRTLEAYSARTRVGRWLADMLERSGSRNRLGDLLVIWLIAGLLLLLLGWALAGLVGTFIILILLVAVPPAALQAAIDHRARLFATQLPNVLKLTASSLRAGFSLLQGLEAVTKQLREPSAGELQRVLAEARLGRPVEDALEAAAARIRNRDFTESVAAVRIQQEAGGNLATLFDTLAETMVQRLRLRREVRTLTAEGRLSAYILGCTPLALGIFIFAINRPYMSVLLQTIPGKVMFVGGLLLQVVGFFWMYRVVKIET
jgi:tight adherence protein B